MYLACVTLTPHTLLRLLTLITTVGLISASLPALALQPFTAHYQASYMGLQGQATATLQAVDHDQWRYTLTIRNAVIRIRQSIVFTHEGNVLRPLRSVSDSRIVFQRRIVEGHYDWTARQATWTGDVKPHRRGPVALEDADMDGLLINLAVIRDLAQDQPLHYRLVDQGRTATLQYKITGTDHMTVNGKPVQATRLERTDRNKQQIAWIVPGLPAPVRLLQREDGKETLEMTLTSTP